MWLRAGTNLTFSASFKLLNLKISKHTYDIFAGWAQSLSSVDLFVDQLPHLTLFSHFETHSHILYYDNIHHSKPRLIHKESNKCIYNFFGNEIYSIQQCLWIMDASDRDSKISLDVPLQKLDWGQGLFLC